MRWIPLGEFDFPEDEIIIFKGRITEFEKGKELRKQALVGQVVSNRVFNGGSISVDVVFSIAEMNSSDALGTPAPYIAEIIVYKNPETGDMVTAGIGGEFFLYSARVWDDKNQKWSANVIKGGYIGNLRLGVPHNIRIRVESSKLGVWIDHVELGSATLPFPIVGTQVGLFCQSAADIRFSNFQVEDQQPQVFIVMPFSSPYTELYTHVFEPVCKRCELKIHRSDRTYGPGLIIADIVQRITESQIIIAEITPNPPNPNVYFEVGFAFAMRKPIILIADQHCSTPLPFDVSPFRVMFYENTIPGKHKFQLDLVKHLNAIIPHYDPISSFHEELAKL